MSYDDLPPVMQKTVDNLSRRSPYTQIGVGAAGGFLTGFVFLKTSKWVALAAGSAILAFELALQAGLIEVDVLEVVRQSGQDHQLLGHQRIPSQMHNQEASRAEQQKATRRLTSSRRLCVSFLGGFLLGFAWA